MDKVEKQKLLLKNNKMVYMGNGPIATGSPNGWLMSKNIYLKCAECGYYLSADPNESDSCFCGKLVKDADHGRIGSLLGDNKIEVYRIKRKGFFLNWFK